LPPPARVRGESSNRRATKLNPSSAGIRTGNPQLEAHEDDKARDSPPQGAPRRRGVRDGGPGERRGG
jgi:hypothetical protein